jgi:hypothetical protein
MSSSLASNSKPPFRDSLGFLSCPRCGTRLDKTKAPFILHDSYVGSFESYVCPICHYSALTAEGYENAISEASRFGLIGPQEPKPVVEVFDGELVLPTKQTTSNTSHDADLLPSFEEVEPADSKPILTISDGIIVFPSEVENHTNIQNFSTKQIGLASAKEELQ